jgi:hypothetical protein
LAEIPLDILLAGLSHLIVQIAASPSPASGQRTDQQDSQDNPGASFHDDAIPNPSERSDSPQSLGVE